MKSFYDTKKRRIIVYMRLLTLHASVHFEEYAFGNIQIQSRAKHRTRIVSVTINPNSNNILGG